MRNTVKAARSLARALILSATAGCLSSCIFDNSLDSEFTTDIDESWISIEIQNFNNNATITRADTGPDKDNHYSQYGSIADNAVNPLDLQIMILDQNKLVLKAYDASNFSVEQYKNNQSTGIRIKLKLDLNIFNYAPGEDIPLSLLITANASSTGFGASDFTSDRWVARTALAISKEKKGFPYIVSEYPWLPDGISRYIPMAGLRHFTAKRSLIKTSSAESPYKIGGDTEPVLLLRAMAKIRVFSDEVDKPYFKVSGVNVSGVNIRGAVMPDFEETLQPNLGIDWNNGTEQVELASVKPEWFSASSILPFAYVSSETSIDGTHSGAWIAYIPEYTSVAAADASMTITAITETNEQKDYTYYFNGDLNIKHLTRNHIYEFTLSRTEINNPDLSYTVCPWATNTIDIPTFN